MPVLEMITELSFKNSIEIYSALAKIKHRFPGCSFMAVSETTGPYGRVEPGGTTHRRLRNDKAVVAEFRHLAQSQRQELEGGAVILKTVAVKSADGGFVAFLVLKKFSPFYRTYSKAVQATDNAKYSTRRKGQGDAGGVGGKLPKHKELTRHLGAEPPQAQDLTPTRRV